MAYPSETKSIAFATPPWESLNVESKPARPKMVKELYIITSLSVEPFMKCISVACLLDFEFLETPLGTTAFSCHR